MIVNGSPQVINHADKIKKQAQAFRFAIRDQRPDMQIKSMSMLNIWSRAFGYDNWQVLIRDIKGQENSKVGIVTKKNILDVAKSIRVQLNLPNCSLEYIIYELNKVKS